MKAEMIPDDRPLSSAEADLVTWMLSNASQVGNLSFLVASVPALRVVGRCPCGCPSVDFAVGGQAARASPIADALGETEDEVEVGIILWGRDDAVTGLELYELGAPVRSLPRVETLRSWPPT